MSDFYVHIRNVLHYGMSDFYVHIRNVFTSRNEWILLTYKERIHIIEWVTFIYISETYSHHGMSDFMYI